MNDDTEQIESNENIEDTANDINTNETNININDRNLNNEKDNEKILS